MVLSFSSPGESFLRGDGGGSASADSLARIVDSTTTTALFAALVVFSFLYQFAVRVVFDEFICCRRVFHLFWWKKKVALDFVVCPKRRARYLRCLQRCEQRRRNRRNPSRDAEATEEEEADCWSHVSCPFSRAARFYKLHLPSPLPLCGKKDRRCWSLSSRTDDESTVVAEIASETCIATDEASVTLQSSDFEDVEPCLASVERASSTSTSSSTESGENNVSPTLPFDDSGHVPPSSVPSSLVIKSAKQPRFQTSLIDLARMQQWTAILERNDGAAGATSSSNSLQRSLRREAKYRDDDGLSALHWACSGGPPVAVVRALVDAYPSAVKKVDREGSTPLHFATHYSASLAVVELLLNVYPKAASKKDKYGRTPLYHAVDKSSCLRIWKVLAATDPSTILTPCLAPAVLSPSASDPTAASAPTSSTHLDRSSAVRTPLFLAWITVISNRQTRTNCQGKCWEKALYLLEAAWRDTYRPSPEATFRFLPAAILMDRYLPEQVVTLALQQQQSNRPEHQPLEETDSASGLHALAIAASMEHYSTERGHGLVLELLKANPRAALIRDGAGRTALAHAVSSGRVWTAGVRALLEADPRALHVRDPATQLSVALIAASSGPDEEPNDYDPSLLHAPHSAPTRASLFLRRHLDPFGFLTAKDSDRMGLGGGKEDEATFNAQDPAGSTHQPPPPPPPPKTDRITTVYELVRADPAAALFLGRTTRQKVASTVQTDCNSVQR